MYILRLAENDLLVGAVSSLNYFSFVLMILGPFFVKRLGSQRVMRRFWFLRYTALALLLISTIFAGCGRPSAALFLALVAVASFYVLRGIGQTGYNPILADVAAGRDRGEFISQLNIIAQLLGIVGGIFITLLFGKTPAFFVYTIVFCLGILSGYGGTYQLYRLPEINTQPQERTLSVAKIYTQAWQDKYFRRYLFILFGATFFTALIPAFLLAYAKRVYAVTDNLAILFTVIGSLGAIAISFINSLLIDHLSAKPLFFVAVGVSFITALGVFVLPAGLSGWMLILILAVFFFLGQLGDTGRDSSAQIYFLSIIKPDQRYGYGIVYWSVMGLAGMAGPLLAGLLTEGLRAKLGMDSPGVYRVLFGGLAVGIFILQFTILLLKDLGKYSMKDALAIMFTPRHFSALITARRLKKTNPPGIEKRNLKMGSGKNIPPVS